MAKALTASELASVLSDPFIGTKVFQLNNFKHTGLYGESYTFTSLEITESDKGKTRVILKGSYDNKDLKSNLSYAYLNSSQKKLLFNSIIR